MYMLAVVRCTSWWLPILVERDGSLHVSQDVSSRWVSVTPDRWCDSWVMIIIPSIVTNTLHQTCGVVIEWKYDYNYRWIVSVIMNTWHRADTQPSDGTATVWSLIQWFHDPVLPLSGCWSNDSMIQCCHCLVADPMIPWSSSATACSWKVTFHRCSYNDFYAPSFGGCSTCLHLCSESFWWQMFCCSWITYLEQLTCQSARQRSQLHRIQKTAENIYVSVRLLIITLY